jgi:hypothetical protein
MCRKRQVRAIDPRQIGHPHQNGHAIRRRRRSLLRDNISLGDVGPSAMDRYDGHVDQCGRESWSKFRQFCGTAKLAAPGRGRCAAYRVWLIIGRKVDDLEHYIGFAY